MFESYKIGVRVSLENEASSGLLRLTGQLEQAGTAARLFQNRLDQIKRTAKDGFTLFGTGAVLATPFIYAIDKAAELQKQMIGIQVATRGTADQMNSMRSAIEKVSATTVFSNIDVAKMGKTIAAGTGLNADQVQSLLPAYARFADVQLLMKGTPYEQSISDAIRLAHSAKKYDPQSLSSYLDLLTKASFIVPGGLGEVGHALKYSQGVAQTALGINDESMVLLTSLLNRMGFAGSRGGTNLIAAMTRTIPGIFGSGLLKGKSAESLSAMGFVDKQGHSTVFKDGKFNAFAWIEQLSRYVQKEFASNPEDIARQDIMKNFQHGFGTQGSRVASLLSDPQALTQLKAIGDAFSSFGDTSSVQNKFATESVAQQWMNAKTNFVSGLTELGYTMLPAASDALKKLNSGLQSMTEWISKNSGLVELLSKALLVLAGGLAIRGTILLVSAAFQGLGLSIAMRAAGGVLGITQTAAALGGVETGLAGIAGVTGIAVLGPFLLAAAAGLAAVYGVAKLLKGVSDSTDPTVDLKNHPGMRKFHTGPGPGHWGRDLTLDQTHYGQHWVPIARAGGKWVNDAPEDQVHAPPLPANFAGGRGYTPPIIQQHPGQHFVPGSGRGSGKWVDNTQPGSDSVPLKINLTVQSVLDGRKVAESVSSHIAKSVTNSSLGMSGFDPSMSPTPYAFSGR